MSNNGFVTILCVLSTLVLTSCAGSGSSTSKEKTIPADNVVGIVGDQEITYEEVTQNFTSGNSESNFELEEIREFLPVYLDYRAKILAADDAGYYQQPSLMEELNMYSKQAAYSYLMDQLIRPTTFEEFKERFTKELKSSHVLIAVEPNASPEDTLEAYNTLIQARNEFLNGASMDSLNQVYSSQRNGRKMGGELPWFSVGVTVKEFEDALFSMEQGDITMPVRTQFGYHIIYLDEKRERTPDRRIQHIFFTPKTNSAEIDSAHKQLQKGLPWADAVRKFTDDQSSANTAGLIGWVNPSSRYNPDFVESVMGLQPGLPYSDPIKTSYGTHIFRLDSVRTFDSESEEDEFIMRQLESSGNFSKSNTFVVNWLKENYQTIENAGNVELIKSHILSADTTTLKEIKALPPSLSDLEMYTFDGWTFNANDFLEYLRNAKANRRNINYTNSWYTDFQEAMVDESVTDLTLKEFPEFSEQIQSYKQGLVVYQINEDSVWSTATIDTTVLMQRYEENPETYSFDTRYYYYMMMSRQDSSLNKAVTYINAGNPLDSLAREGYNIRILSDSTESYDSEPYSLLSEMDKESFSDIFPYNKQKAIFYLVDILEPRKMTFDEAFNRLVSDYQPVREQKWLENLRSTYNIELFPDNLEKQYMKEQSIQ